MYMLNGETSLFVTVPSLFSVFLKKSKAKLFMADVTPEDPAGISTGFTTAGFSNPDLVQEIRNKQHMTHRHSLLNTSFPIVSILIA